MTSTVAGTLHIANPISRVAYRLMMNTDAWRIVRSIPAGTAVRLTHLRGVHGDDGLPLDLVEQFIAGEVVAAEAAAAAQATYRQVVIADFLSTSERLTIAAVAARRACVTGLPGFRPQSPALRSRFERASRALHEAWLAMAAAWSDVFGRVDPEGVPDWMLSVWQDEQLPWDRRSALETL